MFFLLWLHAVSIALVHSRTTDSASAQSLELDFIYQPIRESMLNTRDITRLVKRTKSGISGSKTSKTSTGFRASTQAGSAPVAGGTSAATAQAASESSRQAKSPAGARSRSNSRERGRSPTRADPPLTPHETHSAPSSSGSHGSGPQKSPSRASFPVSINVQPNTDPYESFGRPPGLGGLSVITSTARGSDRGQSPATSQASSPLNSSGRQSGGNIESPSLRGSGRLRSRGNVHAPSPRVRNPSPEQSSPRTELARELNWLRKGKWTMGTHPFEGQPFGMTGAYTDNVPPSPRGRRRSSPRSSDMETPHGSPRFQTQAGSPNLRPSFHDSPFSMRQTNSPHGPVNNSPAGSPQHHSTLQEMGIAEVPSRQDSGPFPNSGLSTPTSAKSDPGPGVFRTASGGFLR